MGGTATTTYRMKLFCKRPDWLIETKKIYNEAELFYYELFLGRPELFGLSAQNALRALEKLTLGARDGTLPEVELPIPGLPAYFRRAAINAALAAAHSYLSYQKSYALEKQRAEEEQRPMKMHSHAPAKQFHSSPVFYKGQYKNFEDGTITLKLYTGASWAWVKCTYRGRTLPEGGEKLSPTIVVGKHPAIHIPVKTEVKDIRKVKERMEANENICGISFTNGDAFAVCAVQTSDGRTIASRFIRGGDSYVHHSKRALERIKQNNAVLGKRYDWTGANKKVRTYLTNLSDYWAHKVSREIVAFCQANHVKTISIANYGSEWINQIAKKTTRYAPVYLALKIKRYLSYKAWQAGIVITEVRPNYTSNKCHICRAYLVKQQTLEKMYRCPNGHTGNQALNTSKNIAMMALKKFGKLAA